jgi:hypothetical protein
MLRIAVGVEDVQTEYDRLRKAGAQFAQQPRGDGDGLLSDETIMSLNVLALLRASLVRPRGPKLTLASAQPAAGR